jgi:hypothetical protein
MSVMHASLRCGWGWAAVALTAGLACTAHAGSRQYGRPIEFSEPKSSEVMTNLQQLATKNDPLKQLEEDLYKPLRTITPKGSLEGVVAPRRRAPAPSPLQSKRAKELLERQRDWVFMTPEDLLGAPTVEEILKLPEYGPDSLQKKDLPAMERYYQSLLAKPTTRATTKGDSALTEDLEWFNLVKEPNRREVAPDSDTDELDLPAGVRESAEALRNVFDSLRGAPLPEDKAPPDSFADPFRLATKTPSPEKVLQHQKLMDEYRAIVDPGWRPPAETRPLTAPDFSLAAEAPKIAQTPFATPPGLSPAFPQAPDFVPDPANPVLGPKPLPDLSAETFDRTKSASAVPSLQPRRIMPRPPEVSAPRRPF